MTDSHGISRRQALKYSGLAAAVPLLPAMRRDAPLPDLIWDTGLSGVRPGETGHLASFKGELHRDTGVIVMESRALDVTLFDGFHVRFTVLLVDAQDFPVPSSIPAKSVRPTRKPKRRLLRQRNHPMGTHQSA